MLAREDTAVDWVAPVAAVESCRGFLLTTGLRVGRGRFLLCSGLLEGCCFGIGAEVGFFVFVLGFFVFVSQFILAKKSIHLINLFRSKVDASVMVPI